MHLHPDVDEALYMSSTARYCSTSRATEHKVGAGGFTFAPRGCAHASVVTSERARLLRIQTPGSGQEFYR